MRGVYGTRTEGSWAAELGLDWENGEVPDDADVGDLIQRRVVRLCAASVESLRLEVREHARAWW